MMLDIATIARGALRGAVQEHDDLARWRQALRSPMLGGRRVGFMHIETGVGATTLAKATARLLATTRTVLAADLSATPNAPGLAHAFGSEPTPHEPIRTAARTTADATTNLTRTDDVWAIWPRVDVDRAVTWATEVAPIARFFDTTITDFGVVDPRTTMPAAANLCDVVCIVSSADRNSAEIALSLARGLDTLPSAPVGVVAVVDRTGSHRAAAQAVAANATTPTVAIPRDTGLVRGATPTALATQATLLQLTAILASRGDVR